MTRKTTTVHSLYVHVVLKVWFVPKFYMILFYMLDTFYLSSFFQSVTLIKFNFWGITLRSRCIQKIHCVIQSWPRGGLRLVTYKNNNNKPRVDYEPHSAHGHMVNNHSHKNCSCTQRNHIYILPLPLFCLLDSQAGSAGQLERKVASNLLSIMKNNTHEIASHLHVISIYFWWITLHTVLNSRLKCTDHRKQLQDLWWPKKTSIWLT